MTARDASIQAGVEELPEPTVALNPLTGVQFEDLARIFATTAAQGVRQRLMQSYLALTESLQEWVDDLELSAVDKLRAEFLLPLIGDSIAPTNTLLGNPQALRKARETQGKSLARGMRQGARP